MKTETIHEPLPPTLHCYTGSMQRIFQAAGVSVSEDLLLGLGAGVGFVYWHSRGTDPFLGGRANVGRPGDEGMEITASRRLGVTTRVSQKGTSAAAEKLLIDNLQTGVPVMLQVDMGYLPYFREMGDFHFGGHMIAAMGLDAERKQVIVADREEKLYLVPLADIRLARGAKCPGMKPNQRAITFDFSGFHQPQASEVYLSVQEVCHGMLHPVITNLGCAGIRKSAQRVMIWEKEFTPDALRRALFNLWVFVDATGGTGGGLFRYMYGRYLQEAAEITNNPEFRSCGDRMIEIGDLWQEIALLAKDSLDGGNCLPIISQKLNIIADREEALWTEIQAHCR